MVTVLPSASRPRRFLTISFSGAGHLLPYHLGVASALLRRADGNRRPGQTNDSLSPRAGAAPLPPVKAVSGSSSGAIAAAVFARIPKRVDDFADRFISDRGRALTHLREILHDEERRGSQDGSLAPRVDVSDPNRRGTGGRRGGGSPCLHVATTRCSDGELKLFHFPGRRELFRTTSDEWCTDNLLRCLEASCRIPASFHPADVLEPGIISKFGFGKLSYPEMEGVDIEGESYVDGGIVAPAPPTPRDHDDGAIRLVVSPISGGSLLLEKSHEGKREMRVSPNDPSWALLPWLVRCRGKFVVRPSTQNLAAMRVSMGAASKEELMDWYERGKDEGEKTVIQLALMTQ
mmetsp:Transcript_38551/g.78636  ORF Transcript_38551/g.78636 Transcript_38551/m.78636 type:complete len:347 (-) Transcript_38551:130-1170(-)